MKSGHEKMSAVDAAWLRMDSATQRMVITAAFHFAEPLGLAEVMALLHERVLVHRRFRQRAVEPVAHGPIGPLGTPHWEEVPDLHPGDHVHELSLPDDADDAALAEVLSELASAPLDRTRPLWTLHLIHGHGAGTVLVVRLHHAIGDGVT
ncbi:MAG: wax ester/triacylglycerol synthase family O-acyltransferase, partial [Myxococcota bacterium]